MLKIVTFGCHVTAVAYGLIWPAPVSVARPDLFVKNANVDGHTPTDIGMTLCRCFLSFSVVLSFCFTFYNLHEGVFYADCKLC